MKRLLGALGILALLSAPPVVADEDLTPDQVAAYVVLVRADQARDREDRAAALAGYREALEKYSALARRNARWHPELVQYRMAYCSDEIERLRAQQEAEPTPPSPDTAGLSPPVPAPPEPPLADAPAESLDGAEPDPAVVPAPAAEATWAREKERLEAELAESRARAIALEADVQRAATEAAVREEERRRCAEQATQHVEQVAALARRATELADQLGARSNDLVVAQTARDRWEQTAQAAERRAQERDEAEAARLRADTEAGEQQRAAARAEAEAQKQRVEALSDQVRQLEERISACAAERDAVTARLEQALAEAAHAAPVEDWPAQVGALRQELERTRAQLSESEREARELLKEVTFLKRRY